MLHVLCPYSSKFQPKYFSMEGWFPWQLGETATFFLVFAALCLGTGVMYISHSSSSLLLVTLMYSSKRGSGSYMDLTKFLLCSASSPRETHFHLRSSSASSQLSRPRFEWGVLSLSHSSSWVFHIITHFFKSIDSFYTKLSRWAEDKLPIIFTWKISVNVKLWRHNNDVMFSPLLKFLICKFFMSSKEHIKRSWIMKMFSRYHEN